MKYTDRRTAEQQWNVFQAFIRKRLRKLARELPRSVAMSPKEAAHFRKRVREIEMGVG